MRFIIHGAGSIGSLIGGRLAESGAEVVLIARHAHAAAINRSGLLVKSRDGDRVVKALSAVTHPRQITPSLGDVIILTVKSSQSAASIQSLRETFPEETPVVCMQNGVRNEEVAAGRFLRVYGGMLGISATFLEAGMVAHTRGELLSVGNYPLGCDNTGLQIAARLEKAGFRTATHESIMAVKWSKLILNLNNATFAIIDKHLQLGLVTPAISNFMADVRGVVEDPAKICAEANSPVEFRTYPSTWMDLKLKRGETESGYFNGEIILLGERYGVPTPYNSTLFIIVETMAAKRAQPGLYTIEELADLVEQRRQELDER